ncbi:MAG TPA: hypothetical protein PL105_27250, partial [Caldilineaceae bacterium]|nr:hypothetical protein [Caldilineaceae bacterium]
ITSPPALHLRPTTLHHLPACSAPAPNHPASPPDRSAPLPKCWAPRLRWVRSAPNGGCHHTPTPPERYATVDWRLRTTDIRPIPAPVVK